MAKARNHENLKRNHGFRAASPAQFGLTLTVLLTGLAAWAFFFGKANGLQFLIGAVFVGLMTALFPKLFAPFNWLWTGVGLALGKMTNPIILTAFYYILLTPIAVCFRLFSKDTFRKKHAKQKSTWVPHEGSGDMTRQF